MKLFEMKKIFTYKETIKPYIKEIDIIDDISDPIIRIEDKIKILSQDLYKMYKLCLNTHCIFLKKGLNDNISFKDLTLIIRIIDKGIYYQIKNKIYSLDKIIYKLKNRKIKLSFIKIFYENLIFTYSFEDIIDEIRILKNIIKIKSILEVFEIESLHNISKLEINYNKLIISPFLLLYNDILKIIL